MSEPFELPRLNIERPDLEARTVAVDNVAEYARLTQSSDFLRRHAKGQALAGLAGGIGEHLDRVQAEQERIYRQEQCEG